LAGIAAVIVPVVGGTARYAGGNIVTLVFPNGPVGNLDLIHLWDYKHALGLDQVAGGTITQIRLDMDPAKAPWVVLQNGDKNDIILPSGGDSGLKIEGQLDVPATGGLNLALIADKALWVHPTGRADTPWVLRPTIQACATIGVERSDFFVPYTMDQMPNAALNGLPAQLHVHRVKPVFSSGCAPAEALVAVHGRSQSAGYFDLQNGDLSLQENLANTGIDTFAVDTLGFGRSTYDSVLAEPANASLPRCATCPDPTAGVTCDCPGTQPRLVLNQQGSACPAKTTLAACNATTSCAWNGTACRSSFLQPADFSPLTPPQAHSSGNSTVFTSTAIQAQNFDVAVDYIRNQFGYESVNVMAHSSGGEIIGPYLGDAQRQAKVKRAIFLATSFATAASPPTNNPTMPLGLLNKNGMPGNFNTAPASCRPGDGAVGCSNSGCTNIACGNVSQCLAGPAFAYLTGATCSAGFCTCSSDAHCGSGKCVSGRCQADPDCACKVPGACGTGCPGQEGAAAVAATVDTWWAAMNAEDPVGKSWGPQPQGVYRFPNVMRFGWTADVAKNITVPVAILVGLKDNQLTPAPSAALYNALTGTNSKVLMQIGCASHPFFLEVCADGGTIGGGSCNGWRGPSETAARHIRDWVLTGMIFASPGGTNGTFVTSYEDGTNAHADPFTVGPPLTCDCDGVAVDCSGDPPTCDCDGASLPCDGNGL
jgi:alpha-beta hydrolase superfamily lysophospholipase